MERPARRSGRAVIIPLIFDCCRRGHSGVRACRPATEDSDAIWLLVAAQGPVQPSQVRAQAQRERARGPSARPGQAPGSGVSAGPVPAGAPEIAWPGSAAARAGPAGAWSARSAGLVAVVGRGGLQNAVPGRVQRGSAQPAPAIVVAARLAGARAAFRRRVPGSHHGEAADRVRCRGAPGVHARSC